MSAQRVTEVYQPSSREEVWCVIGRRTVTSRGPAITSSLWEPIMTVGGEFATLEKWLERYGWRRCRTSE